MKAKPISHHKVNVLESRMVFLAEKAFNDPNISHHIPLHVKEAYTSLKAEVVKYYKHIENGELVIHRHKPSKTKSRENAHPAITGLSIGGAKEVIDYIFGIAIQGDRVAQGFLELPFIDGLITAIIATIAAWFSMGEKK